MESLKKQGKIRYWGLSLNTFHPQPEAEFMIRKGIGDGFQLVFNLINQRALDLLKPASEAGFGLIARMPLQFGLLTGKLNTDSKFPTGDHRSFRLTPEILTKSLTMLNDKVWPHAKALDIDKVAFALSFILTHQEISTTIPGLRTTEQVIQNTGGIHQLDEGLVRELEQLSFDWEPVVESMEKLG